MYHRAAKALFLCVAAVLVMGASAPFEAGDPENAALDVVQTEGAATSLTSGPAARLLAKAKRSGSLRVIVGLDHQMSDEDAMTSSEADEQRAQLDAVQSSVLGRIVGGDSAAANATLFETVPYLALDVTEVQLERLLKDPRVVSVQEDALAFPSLKQSTKLIQARKLWTKRKTGRGWVVAVLDTGVDTSHKVFKRKVASEACYSGGGSRTRSLCPRRVTSSVRRGSGKNCRTTISGCDHGTHVAATAAGLNGLASGVARKARIIPIQVFSRFTSGCPGGARSCVASFTSDQMKALERVYKLRNRFKIASVNMSLGGGQFSAHCDFDARKAVIDKLKTAGIAVAIASGNNGFNGFVSAPACISSAVTVGNTTKTDRVAPSSNHADMVDLMAPGTRIKAAVPGNKFGFKTGTSMATPHVAGAFALMRQVDPKATVDEISAALACTGKDVDRNDLVKPRINVFDAFRFLKNPKGGKRTWLFNRTADAKNWVQLLGRWAVSGGKFVLTRPAPGQWHVAYHKNCDPALEVIARMKRTDPLTTDKNVWYNTGLFVKAGFNRKTKTVSGYWFAYNGLPQNVGDPPFGRVVIWRLDNFDLKNSTGSGSLLCSLNTAVNFNGFNTLKVVSRNGQHDFFLNGGQVCSATDASFTLGEIAVVMASPPNSSGHRLSVDHVRAKRLDSTTTIASAVAEPTLPIAQPAAYGEGVLFSTLAR